MAWTGRLKSALIFSSIFFLSVEFFAFLASRFNLLPYNNLPVVYRPDHGATGIAWRTENSPWGAWHKTGYSDRHASYCFDVKYQSNNFGARDDDFSTRETAEFVLLGDSFAEGTAADKKESSEALLEEKLGVKILNFGSGGNFGPLQYDLIYEQLANKFDHRQVLLYFFPANDFVDNDYAFCRTRAKLPESSAQRYRPYFISDGTRGFSYFYPAEAVKSDCFNCPPSSLRTFLIKYSWTGNLIRTIESLKGSHPFSAGEEEIPYPADYSGYFDANLEQQRAAVFFIRNILNAAGGRPVTIVVIPDKNDLKRLRAGADPTTRYWYREFISFNRSHRNVNVIDLAHFAPEDIDPIFLSCDPHWTPSGHRWAADVIASHFVKTGR